MFSQIACDVVCYVRALPVRHRNSTSNPLQVLLCDGHIMGPLLTDCRLQVLYGLNDAVPRTGGEVRFTRNPRVNPPLD